MPFITVLLFSIHSLLGKNRDNIVTVATLGSIWLPVSKLLLFPHFAVDVAQPELHTGLSNGSVSFVTIYRFFSKEVSFLLFFVIRKEIENKARNTAVMPYQSCIVSDGADLLPHHKVPQKIWKRYRER